jgi:GTP cyclohydrolase I
MAKKTSEVIIERLKKKDKRYFAGDNISDCINNGERDKLIDEIAENFESVLRSMVIDVDNDPNSQDTARRLAKMYVKELFAGRYNEAPPVTAFPNDDEHQSSRFEGLLNVRAEITSICSHHHQPVKGICHIGIIPSTKVIGLSKYVRLAQHEARRGTLQEELVTRIRDTVMEKTGSRDVGVHILATHGCMENRGICANNSGTHTTALSGQFYSGAVREEWMQQVMMSLRNDS